jgi:hypothetical protein
MLQFRRRIPIHRGRASRAVPRRENVPPVDQAPQSDLHVPAASAHTHSSQSHRLRQSFANGVGVHGALDERSKVQHRRRHLVLLEPRGRDRAAVAALPVGQLRVGRTAGAAAVRRQQLLPDQSLPQRRPGPSAGAAGAHQGVPGQGGANFSQRALLAGQQDGTARDPQAGGRFARGRRTGQRTRNGQDGGATPIFTLGS